jgi:MYXO-CTERM domain-containing protein
MINRTCIVAISLAVAASAHGTNLLSNSGFETGDLTGWSQNANYSAAGGLWSAESTVVFAGNYAAVCDDDTALYQTFAPVAVSTVTAAGFEILQNPGEISYADLLFSDGRSAGATFDPTTSWTYVDLMPYLNDGNGYLDGIEVYGYSIGGTEGGPTYVDNFVVNTAAGATPSPAAILPFGLGLLARRRRKA